MNAFTIKDLENLTGIKAHTIRIWEQRYSFLKPQRTDTNIRYYSGEELKKVLNISLLNKYGFKISHIDGMSEDEISGKITALSTVEAQQERVINNLIQCMIDLDMRKFEDILDEYIRTMGVEKAICQVIFPYMERIGVLWITGHINPAQEHLVSNIIRQKIIVGTDSLVSPIQVDKTGLLFLPEGEFHELGLLFILYMLKRRGVQVLYLGANVPIDDLEFVVNMKQPDFLYTHLTSASNGFNFERFMTQASKKFADREFVVSGRLAASYEKKIPPKFRFMRSLPEVTQFISDL